MEFNYWVIIIAGTAYTILGALWYSPLLFGNVWVQLKGKTETGENHPKSQLIFVWVTSIFTAYILQHFVVYGQSYYESEGITNLVSGLNAGFWGWLGFVALTNIHRIVFDKIPFELYLIDVGYYFVSFIMMGAILGYWG